MIQSRRQLSSIYISLTNRRISLPGVRYKLIVSCSHNRSYLSTQPVSIENASNNTHFGFKNVPVEEKEKLVGNVFSNVADDYDRMNDILSFGLHRLWKDRFIEKLSASEGTQLLDVAGGTGDISFRFIEHMRKSASPFQSNGWKVTVLDINERMLSVGKDRAQKLNYKYPNEIDFIHGNAEHLPGNFDDQFDAYTIAFGIRNCTNINAVLKEAQRVLKPGGRFMCLEFTPQISSNIPFLNAFYELYSFNVIPLMGQLFANDRDSYQYLVESIRKFPDPDTFGSLIEAVGFEYVQYELLAHGVAIHSGFKKYEE